MALTARPGSDDMSKDEALIGAIVDFVFDRVVVPLEKRLDALEKRPDLKYMGVWVKGGYEPGNCVTFDGSLWICVAATKGKPGPSAGWRLAVKRGQDARP